MSKEPSQPKPTYRILWWDQGMTLLDIWQGGTKLEACSLNLLWNGSLVSLSVAQQALNEYNALFGTHYTLAQVNIPTIESLGYGSTLFCTTLFSPPISISVI
jgi:hypothetical protein